MALQRWEQAYAWSEGSGTAVANTTTETILFPNVTIRGNDLSYVGAKLRISANGQYSTTGTPTLLFSLRWGGVAGTLLAKSAAITGASGVTAALWELEALFDVRSSGSAGTVMVNGHATVHSGTAPTVGSATGAPGISPLTNGGIVTPAVATVDLTTDTALSLTLTWSAASSSNTATGLALLVEWLN